MIRASLLLLLALGTVAQAFPYAPTYRFGYLKPGSRPPKNIKRALKPTPKPGPGLPHTFVTPMVPVGSLLPPLVPGNAITPIPLSLVTPTTYIGTPPGGVIAALIPPPAPFTPPRVPFAQPVFLRGPPMVPRGIPRPENITLLSKLSSGPSVTTTVFRAPGGVTATSVQRVEGTSTSLFSESDSVGGKVTTTRKPVGVLVPATVGRIERFPPNVPPLTYLVYQK